MAGIYEAALEAFGNGQIQWLSDNVVAHLVNGYTPDFEAHATLSEVPAEAILSSTPLEQRTNRRGYLGAAEAVFSTAPMGSYGGVLVTADGKLVAYLEAPGSSMGGPVRVRWDERGIVRL